MENRRILFTVTPLLAVALLGAGSARAGLIPIGSSLTFGGYNGPGTPDSSWSDTVTFSSTPVLVDDGSLELYETQTPTAGGGEWDAFYITTVSGGPLVGDINGDWNIVMDYDLSAPANFDGDIIQFSDNGTAFSPITDFGGCCGPVATSNPIFSGEAYYNPVGAFSGLLSAGVQSNWQEIFIDPYSFVADGGIDPSTANGFSFALHLDPLTPTPEPGSFALLLCAGATGLAMRSRRRSS